MKIKPIYIFMVAALAIVVAVVFISCPYINATEEEAARKKHYSILNKNFDLNIPQEWTVLYYNKGTLGGFDGCGSSYSVFETTVDGEEFLSEFSDTENEEFEASISNTKNAIEKISPIEQEYLFDFSQPYKWLWKYKSKDENHTNEVQLIYQSQRVYIGGLSLWTKNKETPERFYSQVN